MIKLQTLRAMPRNVWILGMASLLNDSSTEMIHALLPLFLVTQLAASVTLVGFIEGLAESIASILKVFSGAFSDYVGKRKPIVVFGYSLSTLVKPLFALSYSPYGVLLARTLDRIGKGMRGAPRDALLADSIEPENRGAAFGLRQSLDTVGAVIGPSLAVAFMLLSGNHYRFVFWCAVVPAVLAVLLLAAGIDEPARKEPHKPRNPLEWSALRGMGRDYWIVILAALIFNLGNFSDAFLILRMKQLGVAADIIPLALVVMNVAYSFSAYPFGALSDRVGRLGLIAASMAFYALVYAGFGFSTTAWQLWGLLAAYGLYMGMSQGTMSALVADKVSEQQRGTAFGFLNLATGIALFPASIIAGTLWDHVSPSAPFFLSALFSILSLLVILLGVKEKRPISD